jgi:hypothetical protein
MIIPTYLEAAWKLDDLERSTAGGSDCVKPLKSAKIGRVWTFVQMNHNKHKTEKRPKYYLWWRNCGREQISSLGEKVS